MLEADSHIARLVGLKPVAALHRALAQHGSCTHRGVDFVPGAIEEAGVDEDDAVLHRMDAGGEVGRRAALLVHHADLDRMARKFEQILNRVEQVIGKGAFLRPVHLGLHDVDRAAARVAERAVAFHIERGDRRGEDRVHDALGHFRAIREADRRVGHQVADIAHEHQAAALEGLRAAVGCGVGPVARQRAGEGLAALLEALRQIAADDAEPVGVGQQLVLGIDRRDRILAVGDGGKRRLDHDIGDPGLVGRAHRHIRIENNFDVQPVVLEQDALLSLADVLARIGEHHTVAAGKVSPASARQREGFVEELPPARDHRSAAFRVIAARPRRGRIERIGAVEGVVEAPPARIGGV